MKWRRAHTLRCIIRVLYTHFVRYRNKSGTAVWRRSGAVAVCARPVRDGRRPATECAWRPRLAPSRHRCRPTTPPGKRCRTCRRPTRWRTRVVVIGRRRRLRRHYRTPSSPWRRRATDGQWRVGFSGAGAGAAAHVTTMMFRRTIDELLLTTYRLM